MGNYWEGGGVGVGGGLGAGSYHLSIGCHTEQLDQETLASKQQGKALTEVTVIYCLPSLAFH